MSIDELAATFKVSKPTFLRYVKNGGVPTWPKAKAEFLARNADPAEWLARTDDVLYGRNMDKVKRGF